MSDTPSLSDFTNMTVDSERGSGAPAVVYDDRDLTHQLNQSAQFKAENDWKKYNLFLGNLKDMYSDVNEIAKQPVLPEDLPDLRNQMGDILKEIADNPHSVFGGGPKYGEIQGKIAQLQSKTSQSKGDNLFDQAHRAYMYRNPDLLTDDNKSLIEGFRKQKLGTRQPYQLDLPGMYDPVAMATTLNNATKTETGYSNPTADNQFIEKGKKTTYDAAKYEKLANLAYDQTDERGKPIRETVQKRFEDFPQSEKDKYAAINPEDPAKAWFVQDLISRQLQDQTTKDDLVPNPGYLKAQELAQKAKNEKGELAVKWANYGLAKRRLDDADGDDLANADAVINEAVSKIKDGEEQSGNTPGFNIAELVGGKRKTADVFQIADPSTLQSFGKLDKDGKTYDVPDFVTYDKKSHQLNLVFTGPNDKGETVVTDRKPLNEREWLSMIVKRKFPNKDIGGVNNLVEDVLKKNGNLYDLSKKIDVGGGAAQPEQKYKAKMADGSLISSPDGKTWYDKDGKKVQ